MYLHMQVFINIVASLSDSRQTGVSIEFGTGFFSEQRAIHGRLAIVDSVAFDSRVVKPDRGFDYPIGTFYWVHCVDSAFLFRD